MNVRWSAAENGYSLNETGARVMFADQLFLSQVYDALVVHDPDSVGTASVTVLWYTVDVMVPLKSSLIEIEGWARGTYMVMPFDDIHALFGQGDALLFIHDLRGPRWRHITCLGPSIETRRDRTHS